MRLSTSIVQTTPCRWSLIDILILLGHFHFCFASVKNLINAAAFIAIIMVVFTSVCYVTSSKKNEIIYNTRCCISSSFFTLLRQASCKTN